jgi:hypothetical protein
MGITLAFAELAKIKLDTLDDPHMLQLGTVGSQSIIKYGLDIFIPVANVKDTSYVDIANFDYYNMIIDTHTLDVKAQCAPRFCHKPHPNQRMPHSCYKDGEQRS